MKEDKDKKSDTANNEIIESFASNVIMQITARQSLLLSTRLTKCILAIKEYGDIPSDSEIIPTIIDDATEGIKSTIDIGSRTKKAIKRIFKEVIGTNEITAKKIIDYVSENHKKVQISKYQSLEILRKCCLVLSLLDIPGLEIKMTDVEMWKYKFLEPLVTNKAREALGYWTVILKRKKDSKNSQGTKKEQRAIKEKLVFETYLRLIKNPSEKKALENLSENKMAKHIEKLAIQDLKNMKTAKGLPVLKEIKDQQGNISYKGISKDTIINILRNRDKLKIPSYKWELK